MCDCAIGVDIYGLTAHSPAQPKVCHLGTEATLVDMAAAEQDVATGEVPVQQIQTMQICQRSSNLQSSRPEVQANMVFRALASAGMQIC